MTNKTVDIAMGITPYTSSYGRIWAWKQYVLTQIPLSKAHYRVIKRVVAMPMRPDREIAANLDTILAGTDVEFWASMEPGFTGAGDAFRGACFFAFEGRPGGSNIPVDYLLHMPADVDYGNPHHDDVQEKLANMFDPLKNEPPPDLIVGDYVPMIWHPKEGRKDNPIKRGIEEHVKEQLRHYFGHNNIVENKFIQRPRSEFFMISKRLFDAVVKERRFAPWDPLPQILIFAANKGMGVERADLGNFYETSSSYTAESIRSQVFRTATQISTEWLRDQPSDKCKVKEQSEKIRDGIQLAFKALKNLI